MSSLHQIWDSNLTSDSLFTNLFLSESSTFSTVVFCRPIYAIAPSLQDYINCYAGLVLMSLTAFHLPKTKQYEKADE